MSGNSLSDVNRWRQILQAQVEASSITDVARQLGYSRSAISLALSGSYKGSTDRIAAAVMDNFTNYVTCPHLDCDIARAACSDHQSRPMPTSDPVALRHWIACRSGCPYSTHSTDDEVRHA